MSPSHLVKDPELRKALEKDPTAGPRPISLEEYRRRQLRKEEQRKFWELCQPPADPPTFIIPVSSGTRPNQEGKKHKKKRGGVRVRLRIEIAKRYAQIVETRDPQEKRRLIAELEELKEASRRRGLNPQVEQGKLKPLK